MKLLLTVLLLFNISIIYGQRTYIDPHEYRASLDSMPIPYTSIPQYRLNKTNIIDALYDRQVINQPPTFNDFTLEIGISFGGNSVSRTFQYESGLITELKASIHNQNVNIEKKTFPYYASISGGWSNLSLPNENGRKIYDFINVGIELGTWYEYFVIYVSSSRYMNNDRNFSSVGIGGGIKLPVSNKAFVNINGEFNKIISGTPFRNKIEGHGMYSNVTLGIGIRL